MGSRSSLTSLLVGGACGSGEDCLGPAIGGFLVRGGAGTALGASIGAHRGNLERGSLKKSLAVTGTELVLGGIAMRAAVRSARRDNGSAELAIGIPILHVFSAVVVERRTTKR